MENKKSESISSTNGSDNAEVTQHYSVGTAIAMIVGIVIGSGIYFKCDDVLKYTGGNVLLGVLVFCIGAFGIIFGSLTLTELSMRTKKNGGVVGYYEDFVSKAVAAGFGWFQTFVYFPTITVVISWVAGIYTCLLFGIENTLEMQVLIGSAYMIVFYVINIVSIKLGGHFQSLATVIKLIPLLAIAVISVFWSAPNPDIPAGVALVAKSSVGIGWLAALAPIAYSFDGWIIATSITNEVKNPKKNMTIALIAGPIIVLGVYLMYFLGLNKMLGSEFILSTGNASINKAGELLVGKNGTTIILTFVIIAIMGVINGVVLGGLRMPQALASKNMIPNSRKVEVIDPKLQLSIRSCIISFAVSVFWMVMHYISQKSGKLGGGDISEISIVFSYVCYIILYLKVLKMKKDKVIVSIFKGIICPVFAIIGSLIILLGGYISNPVYVTAFLLFCLSVAFVGFLDYRHNIKSREN